MTEGKLKAVAISGGVWRTRSVEEQPGITLTSWSVRQLAGGDRHFVGWCAENCEGRTSSKIVVFDPSTRRGITSTGRVYQLSGPPGLNSDADYVWNRWLSINGLEHDAWTDVSKNIVEMTQRA